MTFFSTLLNRLELDNCKVGFHKTNISFVQPIGIKVTSYRFGEVGDYETQKDFQDRTDRKSLSPDEANTVICIKLLIDVATKNI